MGLEPRSGIRARVLRGRWSLEPEERPGDPGSVWRGSKETLAFKAVAVTIL